MNKYLPMLDNHNERPEDYKFSRPEKIAIVFAVSPLILLFLINFIIGGINRMFGNEQCFIEQEYLKMDFNGIIKVKGFDEENHNYPFIDVVSWNNRNEHIFLVQKKKELWDKIESNDHIIKREGSLDFNITRDSIKLILTPTFNCGVNDFWIRSKKYPGLY